MHEKQPPSQNIRVVVADSQHRARFALGVMLSRRPNIRIVGEVDNSRELLILVSQVSPDIVLLSWGSPGLAEDDLPQRVLQAATNLCLIVLSERLSLGPPALAAGARAFVYKGNPPEELLTALDRCMEHRRG